MHPGPRAARPGSPARCGTRAISWRQPGYNGGVTLPQVLLVPGNPLDLRSEDLRPLFHSIEAGSAASVDVGLLPQHGYGVTWWEVLVIYVAGKGAEAVMGHLYQLLLDEIREKVKEWYRERRLQKDDKRLLFLDIRDEEEHVLRALELNASGEVQDVTEREQEKPLRPRPEPGNETEKTQPPLE